MKRKDLCKTELVNGTPCVCVAGHYLPLELFGNCNYICYWVPVDIDNKIEDIASQWQIAKRDAVAVVLHLGLEAYYKGE